MSNQARTTIAVIDLAAATSREPDSPRHIDLAVRQIAGMSVLEWITRRLAESMLIDRVIVTGQTNQLPAIRSMSLAGARWMPSPHADAVSRAHDVCQRCDASWTLFVSTACPLVDAGLNDRLISCAWKNPDADFVACMGRTRADIGARQLGLVGQAVNSRAIAALVSEKVHDSHDVPAAVCGRLDLVRMRLIPLPQELVDCKKNFAITGRHDMERLEYYLESRPEDVSWQQLLHMAESV